MSHPRALAALTRLERFGVRLGLERIRGLLESLGDPHLKTPVVLVAGTNGKGSTAALLASIVGAAGYRVGLYTSPHIEEVEERLRVNGRSIDESRLAELLLEVLAVGEGQPSLPTYFEALTATAFCHFARERVDLAILEVGLGGRLDATNVCDPILCLITPISFDHQKQLGTTLGEIAREKAGILRSGRPVLTWVEDHEAAAVIRDVARRMGAKPLLAVHETVAVEGAESRGWRGEAVKLTTATRRYQLGLPLAGRHQVGNLALAVLAAETLARLGWDRLDPRAIETGVAGCRWPGRLEVVEIPEVGSVILDGAHNPQASQAVVAFLERQGQSFDLLFGALADKEVDRILPPLAMRAHRVILTAPDSSRACDPHELVGLVPPPKLTVERDLARAMDLALAAGHRPLLVCGSLYLVGGARRELRQRFGVPEPAVEVVTGCGAGAGEAYRLEEQGLPTGPC